MLAYIEYADRAVRGLVTDSNGNLVSGAGILNYLKPIIVQYYHLLTVNCGWFNALSNHLKSEVSRSRNLLCRTVQNLEPM